MITLRVFTDENDGFENPLGIIVDTENKIPKQERQKIAKAGCEEIVKRHRLDQRLQILLEKIKSGPQNCAPARSMAKNEVLTLYASLYEKHGRVSALLRLAAEQKSHFKMRLRILTLAFRSFLRRAMFGW